MTDFEKYVFILCLIVFILLTAVFSSMLVVITRQSLRLIRCGEEDERLFKERLQTIRLGKRETGWLAKAITVFFALIVFAIFGFTVYMKIVEDKPTTNIPSFHVVQSGSMSDKYEKNTYLFENDLNNQFSRFDVVITRQLPKEEDLQLYDIVVYEVDDVLLIHRIVGIEEPNEQHPDERYFLLQGDLVEHPDKFPVRYSQMKGIYKDEKVRFIGSFFMFLQSPAGYLCILLILVEMISTPFITRKIAKAEEKRLAFIETSLDDFIRQSYLY